MSIDKQDTLRIALHAIDGAFNLANKSLDIKAAEAASEKNKKHKELLLEIQHRNRLESEDRAIQRQMLFNEITLQQNDIYKKEEALSNAGLLTTEFEDQIVDTFFSTPDGENILQDINSFSANDLYTSLDEVEGTGSNLEKLNTAIAKNKQVIAGLDLMLEDTIAGEQFANKYLNEAKQDFHISIEELGKDETLQAFMEEFTDDTFLPVQTGENSESLEHNKRWNLKYFAMLNALDTVDRDVVNSNLTKLKTEFIETAPTHLVTIKKGKDGIPGTEDDEIIYHDERLDPNSEYFDEGLAKTIYNVGAVERGKQVVEGVKLFRDDVNRKVVNEIKLKLPDIITDTANNDTGIHYNLNNYSKFTDIGDLMFSDSDSLNELKRMLGDDIVELIDRGENNQSTWDEIEELLLDYKKDEGDYGKGAVLALIDIFSERGNENLNGGVPTVTFKASYKSGQYYDWDGKRGIKNTNVNDSSDSEWNPLLQISSNLGQDGLKRLHALIQMWHYADDVTKIYNLLEDGRYTEGIALNYLHDANSAVFGGITYGYIKTITDDYEKALEETTQSIEGDDIYKIFSDILSFSESTSPSPLLQTVLPNVYGIEPTNEILESALANIESLSGGEEIADLQEDGSGIIYSGLNYNNVIYDENFYGSDNLGPNSPYAIENSTYFTSPGTKFYNVSGGNDVRNALKQQVDAIYTDYEWRKPVDILDRVEEVIADLNIDKDNPNYQVARAIALKSGKDRSIALLNQSLEGLSKAELNNDFYTKSLREEEIDVVLSNLALLEASE